MATLISRSLAFDSIASFPGRFADQILPEKLHILNASSFLVARAAPRDSVMRMCRVNIAYSNT